MCSVNKFQVEMSESFSLFQCELYHWVDLLDRFDLILDEAAKQTEEVVRAAEKEEGTSCVFLCPKLEDPKVSSCVVNKGILICLYSV